MRHKYEALIAVICFALIVTLVLIIGLRAERPEAEPETPTDLTAQYEARIAELETELEREREGDRIEIEHIYIPLPTDYENIGTVMPEESDAVLLAKTLWGEYRDSTNYAQCAAVCWCILNRVDNEQFPDTVCDVVTQAGQFHGYRAENPVDAGLYAIAFDVLGRWQLERYAVEDVGRVLPRDYLWFEGNGTVNTYRNSYTGGGRIVP